MKTNPPSVLIVEDDPAHLKLLVFNVIRAGYAVHQAENGGDAWRAIKEIRPDVVLLDWMIPGISGIDICRMMRSSRDLQSIPVIMISAREDEADRVCGLENGADDYVVKPYSIAELLVRLKVQIRRTRPVSAGLRVCHEDIIMDSSEHRVYRKDRLLKLGPKEFHLLAAFLEQPGRVWSRGQLLDRVWGLNIHIEHRTVDVHVGRLRKELRRSGDPDPIRTVRGVGYALD